MPYARKSYAAKPAYRKRVGYQKKYPLYKRIEGGMGTTPTQYVTLRKTATYADAVQLFGESLGSFDFHLNNLPGYASLIQTWDEYRVTLIKLTFRPMYRCNGVVDKNLGMSLYMGKMAMLYTAIDKTDGSSPATISEIEEYQSCYVTDDSKPHVRTWKPRAKMATANPAASVEGVGAIDQWFATADPDIRYYGLKWGIRGTEVVGAQEQSYSVVAQITVQFRTPN